MHALLRFESWSGLLLEGPKLQAVVAARDELPFAPPRTPAVFVHSVTKSGEVSRIQLGELARVVGANYLPPARSGQPVRILFDQEVVAQGVPVRDDGTFSVEIRVQRSRGEMVVAVEQGDERRLTIARTIIDVYGRE